MEALAECSPDAVAAATRTAGNEIPTNVGVVAEGEEKEAEEEDDEVPQVDERHKHDEETWEKDREETIQVCTRGNTGVQKGDWILMTGIAPHFCVSGPVAYQVGLGDSRSFGIRRCLRPLCAARFRLQRQMHGDIAGGGGHYSAAAAAALRASRFSVGHGYHRAWCVR